MSTPLRHYLITPLTCLSIQSPGLLTYSAHFHFATHTALPPFHSHSTMHPLQLSSPPFHLILLSTFLTLLPHTPSSPPLHPPTLNTPLRPVLHLNPSSHHRDISSTRVFTTHLSTYISVSSTSLPLQHSKPTHPPARPPTLPPPRAAW